MPTRAEELTGVMEKKYVELRDLMEKGIIVDGQNVEVKNGEQAKKLFNEIKELKSWITMANVGLEDNQIQKALQQQGVGSQGGAPTAALAAAGIANGLILNNESVGAAFVKSDQFKAFQKTGGTTMIDRFEFKGRDISKGAMPSELQRKDVYTALGGTQTIPTLGTVQFDPAVPRAFRPNRVRDLFPVATTNANMIDYFRVTGFTEGGLDGGGSGNAQTVPERSSGQFGLKPHSNLNFEPANAVVRTIAHWEAAHRNIINDEPQLQTTINNELLYGLALVEDDQILNGDGNGENLLGILNTPGIQTYTPAAAEIGSDTLRKATTLAVLANYPPTGYVLHPNDWQNIELQKGTTGTGGDGQYMLITNIAIGAAAQAWRQPVVETPAMTEGTFLNGAFGLGVQLYDREQANVRIAEQHADFFVRNAVVILCEERLALAVKRPESLIKGEFDLPA